MRLRHTRLPYTRLCLCPHRRHRMPFHRPRSSRRCTARPTPGMCPRLGSRKWAVGMTRCHKAVPAAEGEAVLAQLRRTLRRCKCHCLCQHCRRRMFFHRLHSSPRSIDHPSPGMCPRFCSQTLPRDMTRCHKAGLVAAARLRRTRLLCRHHCRCQHHRHHMSSRRPRSSRRCTVRPILDMCPRLYKQMWPVDMLHLRTSQK